MRRGHREEAKVFKKGVGSHVSSSILVISITSFSAALAQGAVEGVDSGRKMPTSVTCGFWVGTCMGINVY